MEWISVKDRFPDHGGKYLCVFSNPKITVGVLSYVKKLGRWRNIFCHDFCVTHWQPLPKPPKEMERKA